MSETLATNPTSAAIAMLRTRHPSKVYQVALGQMRTPQPLVTQREFVQAHADSLCAELDLNKLGLLILNRRDRYFWIIDGQHRVAALKAFGFSETDKFDAEVFDGLSDAEMAEIFLGRNKRRRVSPFSYFHVACTAEHKRETDIRRSVESNRLVIGRAVNDNTVGAVSALGKVYDRSGDVVLGQALRALRDGYGGDPTAFSAELIRGMGLVYNRYNGRTDEHHMVQALAGLRHGHRGLTQRARALKEKTGIALDQCVAAAVVELYNKHAKGKQRLTDWWKSEETPKES